MGRGIVGKVFTMIFVAILIIFLLLIVSSLSLGEVEKEIVMMSITILSTLFFLVVIK